MTWSGERFKLIPSVSVYRELKEKLTSSQKDPKLIPFLLGMLTFKKLHLSSISTLEERGRAGGGDVKIRNEAKSLKSLLPSNVILVTMDSMLANSSKHELKVIHLKNKKVREEFDIGEFLHCLSYSSDYYRAKNGTPRELFLELNGKNVVKVSPDDEVIVTTLDEKYNYAKVLEVLRGLIR